MILDDDLWSYPKGPAFKPPGPGTDSDDDGDPISYLPKTKRRKLQKRGKAKLQTIVLDDDDDEAVGSQASQPAAVQPPASSAGPADLELQLLVPRRRTSVVQDEATQRLLEANRKAMEELERATKEEPISLSDSDDVESQKASPARSRSPTPAIAEEKVLLVCKTEMRGEVKCALRPTDPFNKLFEAFRKHGVQQGWFASDISIRLEFDGELLRGHETPASKDCDEGDVIDVMF